MPFHLKLSVRGLPSRFVFSSVFGIVHSRLRMLRFRTTKELSRRARRCVLSPESFKHQPIRRIASKRTEFRDEAMDEYGIKGRRLVLFAFALLVLLNVLV